MHDLFIHTIPLNPNKKANPVKYKFIASCASKIIGMSVCSYLFVFQASDSETTVYWGKFTDIEEHNGHVHESGISSYKIALGII